MLRLSTHKESPEHFFTPAGFGDVLYMYFIFDIPRLLDLCSIYGNSNGPLLSKMVKNIFDQQPQYKEDLKMCANDIEKVMRKDGGSVYAGQVNNNVDYQTTFILEW